MIFARVLFLSLGVGFRVAYPAPQQGGIRFSGTAALTYTAHAVSYGQRPSGSDSINKLRDWIYSELKPLGPAVTLDSFKGFTPAGPVAMTNIVAKFPGTSGKAIVITGHYDTKRIPMVNFVGANDGGSSTGFLLELAHAIARQKRSDDMYLIWFDGEEALGEWSDSDSRYGSRHLAEKWFVDGTLSKVKALINVDMIGDKDLDIAEDMGSSSSLRELVWRTANELGDGKYFLQNKTSIDDDHMPFVREGVSSLDIIDFNYGPRNSYWHTDKDTMDKLSAHSLQVVGDVLVATIHKLEAQ